MFAKSRFGSLLFLFVALMEDCLCIGFFAVQDMVDDACEFMCGCGNGLRSAKPGSHPAEKRTEVVLGTGERFSTEPEHDGDSVLHLSCLGGEHFAAADSFIRAESQPGGKCGGIAESTDIGSDFGEDHLCGDGTHSRDIGEIDAGDAVQFTAKVE